MKLEVKTIIRSLTKHPKFKETYAKYKSEGLNEEIALTLKQIYKDSDLLLKSGISFYTTIPNGPALVLTISRRNQFPVNLKKSLEYLGFKCRYVSDESILVIE